MKYLKNLIYASLQIKRLKSRGLNTTAAQKRIDAQLPTATKVIGADFTINTEKEASYYQNIH